MYIQLIIFFNVMIRDTMNRNSLELHSHVPMFCFFPWVIQNNSELKYEALPSNSYDIYLSLGHEWDDDSTHCPDNGCTPDRAENN